MTETNRLAGCAFANRQLLDKESFAVLILKSFSPCVLDWMKIAWASSFEKYLVSETTLSMFYNFGFGRTPFLTPICHYKRFITVLIYTATFTIFWGHLCFWRLLFPTFLPQLWSFVHPSYWLIPFSSSFEKLPLPVTLLTLFLHPFTDYTNRCIHCSSWAFNF